MQALIDAATDVESKAVTVVLKYAEALLSFHVGAAVTAPLRKDSAVTTWLLGESAGSDSDIIGYQVMRGLQQSDVVELAEWLNDVKKDWWSTARLWEKLGKHQHDKSESLKFMRNVIQTLERVPSASLPDAAWSIQYEARKIIRFFSNDQSEKDISLEWMISLIDDPVRSKQLLQVKDADGASILPLMRNAVAQALIGFIVSKVKSHIVICFH